MILTVTLNPCIDYAFFVDGLTLGDTNRITSSAMDAGGKGLNLSRIAHELGAKTLATGLLGGRTGNAVKAVLDHHGVAHSFSPILGETRTNFSVEDAKCAGAPTTYNSRGPAVTNDEWESFLAHYRDQLGAASFVALCGSIPPGVPIDAYRVLGELARAEGKPLLIDADGEPLAQGLLAKPTMIKPNQKEAERLLGIKIANETDALEASKTLAQRLDAESTVIVSRGADGAVANHKGQLFVGTSPKVQARSTIGSGDSLLGGLIASLLAGQSFEQAFQLGLAAGAATATTDGSEIGDAATIRQLAERAEVRKITA